MNLLIISIVVVVVLFIKDIKNATNCCNDCLNYKICHGDSYNRNNLESPACKNFKGRD